jgi:hypothetical protein
LSPQAIKYFTPNWSLSPSPSYSSPCHSPSSSQSGSHSGEPSRLSRLEAHSLKEIIFVGVSSSSISLLVKNILHFFVSYSTKLHPLGQVSLHLGTGIEYNPFQVFGSTYVSTEQKFREISSRIANESILGSVDYILEAPFHPFLPFSKQSPVSSTISEVLVTSPITRMPRKVQWYQGRFMMTRITQQNNHTLLHPIHQHNAVPSSSPSSFYKIIFRFSVSKEFRTNQLYLGGSFKNAILVNQISVSEFRSYERIKDK